MSQRHRKSSRLNLEALDAREVPAVNIVFDYSLDTKGFFNDSSRRALLDKAATMIEARLNDTLGSISPGGSNSWKPTINHPGTGQKYQLPTSTRIAANTIVVYAGGRDLPDNTLAKGGAGSFSASGSSAWLKSVQGRGEPGVVKASPTDVAPWGGSITFDTIGTKWHFGTTTEGLETNESDFLSVGMHELGHVMGLGASKSWERLISDGTFTGANAKAEFGGNVPLHFDKDHYGHFDYGTESDDLEAAMDPDLNDGARKLFGDLDFAAMKDIGWEVSTSNNTIYQAKNKLAKPLADTGAIGEGLGVSFVSQIESLKDVDIYRIYAGAGVTLSVGVSKTSGGTPMNTYLKLFDTSGKILKSANQAGKGGNDHFEFTSTRADYYFVAVSSYDNRNYDPFRASSGPGGTTGDYQISITLE